MRGDNDPRADCNGNRTVPEFRRPLSRPRRDFSPTSNAGTDPDTRALFLNCRAQ